jgi:uncharacterized membrane protein
MTGWGLFELERAICSLIHKVAFVLGIILMAKGYPGEKLHIPVVAGIAQSFPGK